MKMTYATSLHISQTNSALDGIPSINLPPKATCRADAPCAKLCYACKGTFRFKNVRTNMDENLEIYHTRPDYYENYITTAVSIYRYFRWHAAGDIPDMAYLDMMVRIAKHLPGTKFLCFTKKFELVNEWIYKNDDLPENLAMVFSAWDKSFEVPNPWNLPVAYIKLKSGDNPPIPEHAHECIKASGGTCAQCVANGGGCWGMKHGDAVYFHEH